MMRYCFSFISSMSAAIFLLPIMFLLLSVFDQSSEAVNIVPSFKYIEWSKHSLYLMSSVSLLVIIISSLLAYLFEYYKFKAKRYYEILIIAPLTIPAYVLAFVYQSLFDHYNWRAEWLDFAILVCVMTASIVPYGFLIFRSAFKQIPSDLIDLANSFNNSRWKNFKDIYFPELKPYILAVVWFALIEALSDFGAASVCNIETLTVGIYQLWFTYFSLSSAIKLSIILILVVLFFNYFVRKFGSTVSKRTRESHRTRQRKKISFSKEFLVHCCLLAYCSGVVLIPILVHVFWVFGGESEIQDISSYMPMLKGTFFIASLVISIVIIFNLCFLYTDRVKKFVCAKNQGQTKVSDPFASIFIAMGYAIPGTVLGLAIYCSSSYLNRVFEYFGLSIGIGQSIFLILFAYFIKFSAIAMRILMPKFNSALSLSVDQTAMQLNNSWKKLILNVHMPMLKSPLFYAVLLIFVEVVKEMPLMLMLRPTGLTTFAVKIYEYSSEGHWDKAAIPSLCIFTIAIIGAGFIFSMNLRKEEKL